MEEPSMRNPVEIEDIEEMRRREGINDVELREEIRGLKIGDFVKLTLLTHTGSFAGETLLVRITRIRGCTFRGKLAMKPAFIGLSKLRVGSPINFTTTPYRRGNQDMNNDILPFNRWNIRGTDSNSLLRLYDLATGVFNKSKSQQERARADRAIQRIAKELQKRKVPL
jgi:hypothetical protein